MSLRRGRRPAAVAPPPANDESEDVKGASITDRRVLRSHYRRLKASIADGKDGRDGNNLNDIVSRVDDLYILVHRPREQIADAEALLDITEAFLNSVKESRKGNSIKAADLVSAIIQNFGKATGIDDDGTTQLDWVTIGLEANAIFHDAQGMHTMLGSMDSEPKKRKVAALRRRERGPPAETARPQTVRDEEGEGQSQTDKNIRTMFNVLRRCGDQGCELEHLVLSRDSFSHTIENIFCLSFLVKDGRAEITIQNGKQFVAFRYAPSADERAGKCKEGEDNQVQNAQFVFRFDFKDWNLMKEIVEVGKELMPKRGQAPPPARRTQDPTTSLGRTSTQDPTTSQRTSTPIRKNSRNRGRVTLSEPCEITIQLRGGYDDNEDAEKENEEEDDLANGNRRVKRRIV